MTESEIMKALKCCEAYNYDACSECPFNRNADCAFAVATNCLDLINRKNAEIERLNEHLSIWKDIAHRETSYLEKARAEAIKEFAFLVKMEIQRSVDQYWSADGGGYNLAEDVIPDLAKIAKEMGVEL